MSINKLIKALNSLTTIKEAPKGYYSAREICQKTGQTINYTRAKLKELVKQKKAEVIYKTLKVNKAYVKTGLFKVK
jgi:hypothetical protein